MLKSEAYITHYITRFFNNIPRKYIEIGSIVLVVILCLLNLVLGARSFYERDIVSGSISLGSFSISLFYLFRIVTIYRDKKTYENKYVEALKELSSQIDRRQNVERTLRSANIVIEVSNNRIRELQNDLNIANTVRYYPTTESTTSPELEELRRVTEENRRNEEFNRSLELGIDLNSTQVSTSPEPDFYERHIRSSVSISPNLMGSRRTGRTSALLDMNTGPWISRPTLEEELDGHVTLDDIGPNRMQDHYDMLERLAQNQAEGGSIPVTPRRRADRPPRINNPEEFRDDENW